MRTPAVRQNVWSILYRVCARKGKYMDVFEYIPRYPPHLRNPHLLRVFYCQKFIPMPISAGENPIIRVNPVQSPKYSTRTTSPKIRHPFTLLTICTTNTITIIQPASFKASGFVPFQINPHYTDYNRADHLERHVFNVFKNTVCWTPTFLLLELGKAVT